MSDSYLIYSDKDRERRELQAKALKKLLKIGYTIESIATSTENTIEYLKELLEEFK